MLEFIDPSGQKFRVPPLNTGKIIALQQLLAAGEPDPARLFSLLRDVLPDDTAEIAATYRPEQLFALAAFLIDGGKPLRQVDGEPVELRFAAALIMKQFAAYTMAMLAALPLTEFLELYRLALTVQADEALMVAGHGFAAALSGNLSSLRARRRELMPKVPALPAAMAVPEPERLAAARRLADEIKSGNNSAKTVQLDDFKSIIQ